MAAVTNGREDAQRPLVEPSEQADEGQPAPAPAAPGVQPSSFRALFRYATGSEVCLLFVAGVLACIAGCAGPAMSFFMKDIVEVIFDPPDERHEKVRPVFLKFVGIAVGAWLTITLSCLTFGRVSDRMSVRMREAFFSHLLHKDVGWYDSNSSAEMTTRLTQDSYDFREGCGIKLALFLICLVQVPLGVAVAFVRDWRFTSILIGVVPLIGIVLGVSMKMSLKRLTMQAELYTKAGGIAETALGCIQTVAAFGGYGREIARYDEKLRAAERDGVKAGQSEAFANSLTAVTFNAVFAFGLEVGSILMLQSYERECWDARTGAIDDCFNGSVMLSCLFAVLTGGFALAPAFQQLGVLNRSRVAASRMYAIIDDPPAFDARCGGELEALRGEVEFRDVHFAYPTRQETAALRAVSFKVPAGSTAAFVGPSGSGKSTSIAMLMRYYDAASGDVLLDGRDIRSLNLSWVRLQMALVQQEPVLFTGTILSNILHGQAEATREDAVKAARVANADGFVSAMEQGYETPVGERGATLSGGQKQRIAIARAMIRDPKVLLLDEATSALDTESERVVMEALDAIVAEGRRTTLIIAHRLSTIKNSDVIFVLEDGSLVEKGTHAELIATDGGLYKQLVDLQNLSKDGEDEQPVAQLTRQLSRQTSQRVSETALSRQTSRRVSDSALSRQSSGLSRQQSGLSQERSSPQLRRANSAMSLPRTASEFMPTNQAAQVDERDDGVVDTAGDAVPNEDEQDKEVPSSRLLGLLSKGWLVVAMVMTGAQSCCGPMMGRLFGHSIDVLSAPPALPNDGTHGSCTTTWCPVYNVEKIHDAVRQTCILYGAVSAVQLVSIYLAGSGFRRVSEGLTRRVRIETFSAIMRQEMAYFDLRTCGQLTDRLAHEAAMIKSFTGESFGGVVRVLVTIVVAMSLALLESWQLTATLMVIMPFMMAGQIFKMKSLKKKDESRAGPVVSEVVGNIKTVAAFGLQDRMLKWYRDILHKEFNEDKRQCTVTAVMEGYNSFVTYMLYGSVMLVASFYIDHFDLDPRSVLQVFFTLVFSLGGISQGITQWQGDKAKGAHALKRIFNTLDRKPLIDAYDEGGLRLEKAAGAIAFSQVHFSYPSQPQVKVFVGFDLAIEAGKRVAFVGPSGSGKSTTIRLLQRFYDPAAGCVTFDGHDLRSLNLQWLRSTMSLVQQEPVLFAGSVLDNIKYGREGATDDEAIAAAGDANAHDFITRFEDGYQTSVGERGAQLSGGQKQRVAIARCMVRRPKVLLLDEATSALDTESERVVQEALDALLEKEQRTTLVIAHRLSTVQGCDMICVVYQGRVVEKGTHQELMRIEGGQYRQLAARQQL